MIKIKSKSSNEVRIEDIYAGRAYKVILGDNSNSISIGDIIIGLRNQKTGNIEVFYRNCSVCEVSALKKGILLEDLGEFIDVEARLTR